MHALWRCRHVCVDGKVPVAYPAFLNALGIAVPDHDIHQPFIDWARTRIDDPRQAALFDRMAARSGIAHRWSVLGRAPGGGSPVMPGGFYAGGMPGTAARMALYAGAAPALGRSEARRVGTEGVSTR